MKKRYRRAEDVILLKDLAPRKDVRGGAGKRLFGEPLETAGPLKRPGQRKTERKKRSPKA